MKFDCYLIFSRKGVRGVRKTMPRLGNGQYAVRLAVEVADSVFMPEVPTVNITVAPPQVIEPNVTVPPDSRSAPLGSPRSDIEDTNGDV